MECVWHRLRWRRVHVFQWRLYLGDVRVRWVPGLWGWKRRVQLFTCRLDVRHVVYIVYMRSSYDMVQYCRSHVRHVLFIVYMRSSYNMVQYCRSDVRHVVFIVYMRRNMVSHQSRDHSRSNKIPCQRLYWMYYCYYWFILKWINCLYCVYNQWRIQDLT